MSETAPPRFADMPPAIARLPVDHRGYPVPWFVAWIDGKPDHRVMDSRKLKPAILEGRCWICGERNDDAAAFVIGPMCAINRISGEPPSHLACAEFAVKACPFLAIPEKRRRETNFPEDARFSETGVKRNPGVALIWVAEYFQLLRGSGFAELLFHVGPATALYAYREGKPATRDEVMAAIDSGLPILQAAADSEGAQARAQLAQLTQDCMALVDRAFPAAAYAKQA